MTGQQYDLGKAGSQTDFNVKLVATLLKIDCSWTLGLKILEKDMTDSFESFKQFVKKTDAQFKNRFFKDKLILTRLMVFQLFINCD